MSHIYSPNICIIACISSNYAIGYKRTNDLIFHIPAELKHFSQTTRTVTRPGFQNVVVMGYNTFVSMGMRALKGRINHIITKNHSKDELPLSIKNDPTVYFFPSPEDSLEWCIDENNKVETAYIIGGASIYQYFIQHQLCTSAIITRILSPEVQIEAGDNFVYFPYEKMLEIGWDFKEEGTIITTNGRNTNSNIETDISYVIMRYIRTSFPH